MLQKSQAIISKHFALRLVIEPGTFPYRFLLDSGASTRIFLYADPEKVVLRQFPYTQ